MWDELKDNRLFYLVISLLCMMTIWSSCTKKDQTNGVPHHIQKLEPSIQDIKDIYSYFDGKDAPLNFDTSFKEMMISGAVISDASSGNLPNKGYFVIQNDDEGIAILLADSTADVPLSLGDLVDINIINGKLTKRDGNFTITGIRLSVIIKLGSDTTAAQAITLQNLSDNFDVYHETLVEIKLAEIVPTPMEGETYEGHKGLVDPSVESSDVVLYIFSNSDLATKDAEANATYVGIAMYGLSADGKSLEKQIWLRNEDDIKENKISSVNAPIVITGFIANPSGADAPVVGSQSSGVTHAGGYEYMQFMALEDIDFSKTPYSVVTCNNRAAQSDGWATGDKWTFKFDLTQGTAKAGTFFYVGGPSKVIDGYWGSHGGLSTDISDANWIRSIVINNGNSSTIAGDGFGNSVGGFLGNSSSADGIAVFEGTTVTPTSVPVDAVFFNAPVGYALDKGNGYLIPNNDFYSQKDPITGDPQLLFGEGTNIYAVPQNISGGGSVQNFWTALGGLVYKKGWIIRRAPSAVTLQWDSQLSDIETGPNVTKFND